MRIDFLNVGYGEAIIVRDGSFCMVVDGGSAKEHVYKTPSSTPLIDFLKKSRIMEIDLMVLTHIHDDHVGGLLQVMEEIPVKEFWVNFLPEIPDPAVINEKQCFLEGSSAKRIFFESILIFFRLLTLAKEKGIPVRRITGEENLQKNGLLIVPLGMNCEEADRVAMEFNDMFRESDKTEFLMRYLRLDRNCNASSLALHLQRDKKRTLLTGDKVEGWEELGTRLDLRSNVLKLTHHGQTDGMPEGLLQASNPDIFVICADKDRTYNSAAPEILERIREYLNQKGKPLQVFITGDMKRSDGMPGSVLSIDFNVDPIQAIVN